MSQTAQGQGTAMAAAAFDAVADILAGRKTGQGVRLRGWVHRSRSAGKMAFVVLRDGSGTVQCTVKAGVADDASLEAAKAATLESSVRLLEGTVVADERAPGGFEVKATRFELHAKSEPFPLRGEQGTEFELDKRHLWLRSTELSAILRIKHRLYKAIHDFYDAEGFAQVDPSVITTNACEGGSTLFTFEYFGQTAYLSQSAQMYLEGCIFGMPKVYCITPSFRAEKSRTSKHLTEFHHLEAEYAWWDAEDNRVHQEKLVTFLAHAVAKDCAGDLKLIGQDPARLLKIGTFQPSEGGRDEPGKRFPRLDYDDCLKELQRQGFHVSYGDDFGVPHEKALTEGRVNPIFICDWPAKIKAFYMAEKPGTDRVFCSDLMAPDGFGEIIGGSQRSEDIESMTKRLLRQLEMEVVDQHSALQVLGEGWLAQEGGLQALSTDAILTVTAELIKKAGITAENVEAQAERFSQMASHDADDSRALAKSMLTILRGSLAGPSPKIKGPFSDGIDTPERREVLRGVLSAISLMPYQWYFDLRRFGSVPHSGFGLGIERVLRWFTGQEHIRDMLPYPRTPSRAYP
ncbi:MAG: asparagine--tRNA ligase [Thermoplasmatota archaeon]